MQLGPARPSSGAMVTDEALGFQPQPEELEAFAAIQARFPELYRAVFSDPKAPRTVVVIPSMSMDPRELEKIPGVIHYEERMLCLLMLLRLPRTQLVYVTSLPIDPAIIDYYLHLLPGIPGFHARRRLRLLTANDASLKPLSQKIMERPDLLAEIGSAIQHRETAHMSCFNTTHWERSLAVSLGIPMYATDPDKSDLGNKTEGRRLFRSIGLHPPVGFEGLRDETDTAQALVDLQRSRPGTEMAVVKLNEGFSGEGNALVDLRSIARSANPTGEALRLLENETRFEAEGENWPSYIKKLREMGGIVEAYITGTEKRSPSVQARVNPLGEVEVISTHDQVLGGPTGQVYEGCTFPARRSYRQYLHDAGRRVGAALRDRGVLGRFGVDFVSVRENDEWKHYAIEINLRKGGTTLPYLMLEFLTDGGYDELSGRFFTPHGDPRTYYATDNLISGAYRGLSPSELIDIAVGHDLHYDAARQAGLVFHLLGAVTEHGKVGMVSIAPRRKQAWTQYQRAVAVLDEVTAGFRAGP